MSYLINSERVVIKVGSSLLTDASASDHLRRDWLDSLTTDIAALLDRNIEVLVVTSGAVAQGWPMLGLSRRPEQLEEKQAAAACGQVRLAGAYEASFHKHGRHTAQILLTTEDTENRRRYLNARHTIQTLLAHGIVPIVNENDTITSEQLRFGDNDRLAARVAVMMSADQLVILSDIDGLYTSNPNKSPDATFIPEVAAVTPEIEAMGSGSSSSVGTGGMNTKITAAQIATRAGCEVIIARGSGMHPLKSLIEEKDPRCTRFRAKDTPANARKEWIAGALSPAGYVVIDDGAARALQNGKSLLPAGVVGVAGMFDRGDPISVKDAKGREVARGLSSYPSHEAVQLCGRKSHEVEEILGYTGRVEMIHRDDMILL